MYGLPEIKVTIPEFNAQYIGQAGYRILWNSELYFYTEPQTNGDLVLYDSDVRIHRFGKYELLTLLDVRDFAQVRQACHDLLNDMSQDMVRSMLAQLLAEKKWDEAILNHK